MTVLHLILLIGWAPGSEAQLTWGSSVSCDHSATAWSIPWNPEGGKRGTSHDQHRVQQAPCQNPAQKASPLLCQGAQCGYILPPLLHSCPGASSWWIQVTSYTCQTSTDCEPGHPTLRFRSGIRENQPLKSHSQCVWFAGLLMEIFWLTSWQILKALPLMLAPESNVATVSPWVWYRAWGGEEGKED